MRIEYLIKFFEKHGVVFSRDGDNLKIGLTRGKLENNETELFRDRKAEILLALDTLDEFAKRGVSRADALGLTDFRAQICDCKSTMAFETPDGLLCGLCEKLNPYWQRPNNARRASLPGLDRLSLRELDRQSQTSPTPKA